MAYLDLKLDLLDNSKGIDTTQVEHIVERLRMLQDQMSVFANGLSRLAQDR